MDVVMVASESTPFFKTGGLADVIGSLPNEIANAVDINVSVILPKHSAMPLAWQEQLEFIGSFQVNVQWRQQYCGIFKLALSGVTYIFIDNEYYFKRDSLYGQFDDAERYVFFTHAVLSTLHNLQLKPAVLHCHDWQTGLLPVYIKASYDLNSIKTIFTIHNLRYQGNFPLSIFHELIHLDEAYFNSLIMDEQINFLKAALVHADWVTTVSPTYANEVKSTYFGEGLNEILLTRESAMTGILNGINNNEFNPATDPALPFNYLNQPDQKRLNKQTLQHQLNLTTDVSIPMFTIITRLVPEKGIPLILHILDELLESENIQLLVLGTGEHELEEAFCFFKQKYPNKFHIERTFNEDLARLYYAASDFFLMPSQFEPCGLSQLIALRYESVPIVRETGGLNDTINSYNEFTGEGNGFSFTNYNAHDLLYTIRRAIYFYWNKEHWQKILQNVYQSDFSWKESAKEYVNLYRTLASKQGALVT
ncbi:glycogen synthase GlgA [Halalkalibacter urbisdiaboli]|uniref:glycogen synthase GlgA n=1 Tax=Halalkalibacter urbisdiaboli TaxID=1960589 RepID=UPI000B43D802|nr:glycogen synthase GlgA [Halalkalibacter urbisdiaboli]